MTNEAVGRVVDSQLISCKSEKNNCFSKFSSNSLDFFLIYHELLTTEANDNAEISFLGRKFGKKNSRLDGKMIKIIALKYYYYHD